MRRRPVLALLLLALAAPACGGSSNKANDEGTNARKQVVPGAGARIMPASDTAVVEQARRELEAACPGDLTAPATRPDPQAAVRTLIREQNLVGPNAIFESGNTDRAVPLGVLIEREARIAAQCGLRGPAAELRRAAS
jgi:hypothetical protein